MTSKNEITVSSPDINHEQPVSNISFLKDLTQTELKELFDYLTDFKNSEPMILNLDNGFAVSVENGDYRITMFNRSEYFVLVGSVRNEHNKRIVNYVKKI